MGDLSILFVDDDANLVEGLRRALRGMRNEVHVTFATDATTALVALSTSRMDAVVTDLRMPGIDGAALLREFERIDPGVVRIVLSGEGNSPLLIRAMGIAHRVVAKPCDVAEIVRICRDATRLRHQVFAPEVKSVINRISRLPSPPDVYRRFEEAVARDASIRDIGSIVAEDPSLSAKLLQAANSSFFSGRRPVSSTQHATTMLGLETTKSLLLNAGLQSAIVGSSPQIQKSLELAWSHANRVAALAQAIAAAGGADRTVQAECFSAAIVHDIGRILILAEFADCEPRIQQLVASDGVSLLDAERQVIGADHAQLAAHLLTLWGLPDDVTEVALRHEDPPESFALGTSAKLLAIAAADLLDGAAHENATAVRRLAELHPGSALSQSVDRASSAMPTAATEQRGTR